jgi:hypothetical protein
MLNFYPPGRYLNFGAQFMKNTLFRQNKIKVRKEWHFVENKTEILQHAFQMQYISIINHHRHRHHPANMKSGHLLTQSGLTRLEVSLMVSPSFFCLLVSSILVFLVI